MSLPKINHTQVSNAYIDTWMRRLKPDCTPVFLSIARKTIGWHKDSDWIPQSQTSEMTGLDIRRVRQAIRILEENHLISIDKKGNGRAQEWRYSINYEVVENNIGAKTDPINGDIGSKIDPMIGAKTDPIGENIGSETAYSKEKDLNKQEKKQEAPAVAGAIADLKDLYDPFWTEAKTLDLIPPDPGESKRMFFSLVAVLRKHKREKIADGLKFAMRWLRYCIRKKRVPPGWDDRRKWVIGEIKYSLDYVEDRGLAATEELAYFAINNNFWSGALFSLRNLYKAEAKKQQEQVSEN